jgi:hypothetical protein
MLMVFLNPNEFTRVALLPQEASFTTVYFVNNVILLLADPYAQQLGYIGHHKLRLHFDNFMRHTVRHVQEQMASHRHVFRVPGPTDSPTWSSQTSICLAG